MRDLSLDDGGKGWGSTRVAGRALIRLTAGHLLCLFAVLGLLSSAISRVPLEGRGIGYPRTRPRQ